MYIKLKSAFMEYYNESRVNIKFILIFSIFLTILFLSMMNLENYLHPTSEIISYVALILFGIFIINYHTLHKDELYKTAFITITFIGVLFSILTPIYLVPDEVEHFARAIVTANGNLFPQYNTIEKGFPAFQIIIDLLNHIGLTFNDSSVISMTGNYTSTYFGSVFQQNPFYGYLASSIGILIAELLNLPPVWVLILGRICNVILYALCIGIAIKRAPVMKIPLFAIACMPLALFQAGSISIDGLINGLALIIIACFLQMLKTSKKISKKKLAIFFILVCLIGFCKVTFFALFLLIFLIPKDKFENKYYYVVGLFGLLVIIAISYSKFYAMPMLSNSDRILYFASENVNPALQIDYMLNHIPQTLIMLFQSPNYLNTLILDLNTFSYLDFRCGSLLINSLYPLFLGSIILLYPLKIKLNGRIRIGSFLISGIIFIGTLLVFLITWTGVGNLNEILGVQNRYFIPLFALAPLAFNFNDTWAGSEKIDGMIVVSALAFLAGSLLLIVIRWF